MTNKILKLIGNAAKAVIVISLFIFLWSGNYVAALFNLAVLFWFDYKPTTINLYFKDFSVRSNDGPR